MKMEENRLHIPGSEWLYVKLYTGKKSADSILASIYPTLTALKSEQVVGQFFFIRYRDPHFHLRLRLQLTESRDFSKVLSTLFNYFEPLVRNGILWNVQIDTYKREVERYGVHTMELSELIFCIDSESIMQCLPLLNHTEGDTHRWLLALPLIDDMLSTVPYSIQQKSELVMGISQSFKQEFGFTTHTYKQQLDAKYRENKAAIASVLNDRSSSPVQPYTGILDSRSSLLKPCIVQIISAESGDVTVDSLLRSFIHMTMNRLFRSQNRLHEMVIYDFLDRYYDSTIARGKKGS